MAAERLGRTYSHTQSNAHILIHLCMLESLHSLIAGLMRWPRGLAFYALRTHVEVQPYSIIERWRRIAVISLYCIAVTPLIMHTLHETHPCALL